MNKMKIILGSTNNRKIEVVKKALKTVTGNFPEVFGFKADSKVPETPYDKQTFDGARNRAVQARDEAGDADMYIGLESGLIERYGNVYEEAWCYILTKDGREYSGYSSGLRLPDYVLSEMKRLNKEHCDVMTILEERHGNLPNDTWGSYSSGMITRENSLEEALRNVLIQIYAPEQSFYKQKQTSHEL
ncbi:MAG: inosine/xanthosine triphosphatase [Candidatus Paceibacterota bacterium]|jgi:non-canonical (house-cleaning) NTP pyrophosphatase